MKISLEGPSSRFELAEENISECKDRLIEIIQSKEQKKKNEEKCEISEKCGTPVSTHQYMHNGSIRR